MKKDYDYRHQLAEDDPYASDYETGGIIRAAFKLAKLAHGRQSREKIDPSIKYISHPIMAYDLMVRMGETRPHVLAATLLHDALEDQPRFAKDPQLMMQLYSRFLEREGYSTEEAITIALKVQEICRQVTNPDLRHESKAMMQMQHSLEMSFEAKIIKIADQTATLICRLMMPDAKSSDTKASEWVHKAENLVGFIRSLPTENAEQARKIDQWTEMFERVYKQSRELLHARGEHAQAHVRANFRKQMPKLVRIPRGVRALNEAGDLTVASLSFPKTTPPEDMIARNDMTELLQPEYGGIARVDLNARGDVTAFAVWVDPTKADKSAHNQLARYAVQVMVPRQFNTEQRIQFPEIERRVHIMADHLRDIEVDGKMRPEGRLHVFDPPMPAAQFAERAMHANALSEGDMIRLIAQSQKLSHQLAQREHHRYAKDFSWVDVALNELSRGGNATGR